MQEKALISQRFVYDRLVQSGKEVWEFPITPELRKSCKLAYQRKRLDDQKKKGSLVETKIGVKRKNKKDEIDDVKRQKLAVEKNIPTLRDNLITEAIAADGNKESVVKAASFAKTLKEKENTAKNLNMA